MEDVISKTLTCGAGMDVSWVNTLSFATAKNKQVKTIDDSECSSQLEAQSAVKKIGTGFLQGLIPKSFAARVNSEEICGKQKVWFLNDKM